ncbi:MAG: hypothetical protein PUF18_05950 [Methanosphaera sp.]|nr:hypothetical protein [Methanosphaera sp.]MDD6535037.1 hypothetical protein [Methanosphaera sp.]
MAILLFVVICFPTSSHNVMLSVVFSPFGVSICIETSSRSDFMILVLTV